MKSKKELTLSMVFNNYQRNSTLEELQKQKYFLNISITIIFSIKDDYKRLSRAEVEKMNEDEKDDRFIEDIDSFFDFTLSYLYYIE